MTRISGVISDGASDGLSSIDADLDAVRLLFGEIIDAITLSPLNWRAPRQWERECRNLREDLRWMMWAAGTIVRRRNWIARLSGDARSEAAAHTLARAEQLREESQRFKERLELLSTEIDCVTRRKTNGRLGGSRS
jgi:hypothetical protein